MLLAPRRMFGEFFLLPPRVGRETVRSGSSYRRALVRFQMLGRGSTSPTVRWRWQEATLGTRRIPNRPHPLYLSRCCSTTRRYDLDVIRDHGAVAAFESLLPPARLLPRQPGPICMQAYANSSDSNK